MSSIEKFIKRVCVQTAVYWQKDGPGGYGGIKFKTPVEVKVRWEDTHEVVKDNTGKELVTRATILTPIDLDEESVLWLGSLDQLTTEEKSDPLLVTGAGPIIKSNKVPMIMSTDVFVRTVYL